MLRFAQFPFGPIFLVFLVPYLQWQRFGVDFSLAEATRLAVILAVAFGAAMVVAYWRLRRWGGISLIFSLITCSMLASFGVVFPIIIFWLLLIFTTVTERRIDHKKMTFVSNVLGVVVFSIYFLSGLEGFGDGQIRGSAYADIGETELVVKPSIVHVVLDGYASSQVLADIYRHDNTAFQQSIEKMGFVVMNYVVTPYNQTLFAMASVMSGGYVEVPEKTESVRYFRRDLAATVTNGNVQKALRRAGYHFAYSNSGIAGLDLDDALQVTPWSPFSLTNMEISFVPFPSLVLKVRNDRLRAAFDPGNYSKLQAPFYYYQHVLAPHPPFSMTPDGAPRQVISHNIADGSHYVRGSASRRAKYIEGYRDMAGYAENALVRQLAALPRDEPIVVFVHGDHGAGAYLDHEHVENSCIVERMTTFLAVYSNVPEIRDAFEKYKDETFNLANIYRVLFSAISNSSFAQLPSKSTFVPYLNPSYSTPLSEERFTQHCADD